MHPAVVQVTEVVNPSDPRHVHNARAGDVRAFDALVTLKLPGAFRLAAAILGDESEAADAAQNALVAAWRELPRLRDVTGFDAWFDRILVNECRMRVRHRAPPREVPAEPHDGDGRGDGAGTTSLAKLGVLGDLEAAFEGLDAEDRAMVVLHDLESRPLAEIAAALHMPVGTVKWRLHDARDDLLRALEIE